MGNQWGQNQWGQGLICDLTVSNCLRKDSETVTQLQPAINRSIDKDSHLMSDEHRSHLRIAKEFSAHCHVNNSKHEYYRGDFHSNTAGHLTEILDAH